MLSLLRRREAPVLAVGSQAVERLARGLGVSARLRRHAELARLLADPDVARTPLLLVQAPMPAAEAILAARARSDNPAEIAVLAEDPLDQIRLRDLDAAQRTVRVRPISRAAMAAVDALAIADRVLRPGEDGTLPAAVVGTPGTFAAQCMFALLRLLHLPGTTPSVALCGPGMTALLARLRAALPELDACGALSAHEAFLPPIARPGCIVAVDGAPGDAALQALDPSGIATIIRPRLPDWEAIGAALGNAERDRVARTIHTLYLAERRSSAGSASQASETAWEDLPERFRDASRHQAEHAALKLRWAGARRVPAQPDPAHEFGWASAELAALAEAEHRRWATVARLEGWSFGPMRDDPHKRTPLLRPFADLPDDVRDLDSLPVRAAPRHFGGAFQRSVVLDVTLPAGSAPPPAALRHSLDLLRAQNKHGPVVIRLDADNPATRALAEAAHACGIPVQIAFESEPGADATFFVAFAERIAIGLAGAALLPPVSRSVRIDAMGRLVTAVAVP